MPPLEKLRAEPTATAACAESLRAKPGLRPGYTRFKGFVDQAVDGNPGYAFSATDAVYVYRIRGSRSGCHRGATHPTQYCGVLFIR
jgi:hypothetical protein